MLMQQRTQLLVLLSVCSEHTSRCTDCDLRELSSTLHSAVPVARLADCAARLTGRTR
jgi:hypothetical protein